MGPGRTRRYSQLRVERLQLCEASAVSCGPPGAGSKLWKRPGRTRLTLPQLGQQRKGNLAGVRNAWWWRSCSSVVQKCCSRQVSRGQENPRHLLLFQFGLSVGTTMCEQGQSRSRQGWRDALLLEQGGGLSAGVLPSSGRVESPAPTECAARVCARTDSRTTR